MLSSWRVIIAAKTYCRNGVVDTFRQTYVPMFSVCPKAGLPKNRVFWKLTVYFWSSFSFFLKQECTRPFRRNCSLKRRPICSNPSGKQGRSIRKKEPPFSRKLNVYILSFVPAMSLKSIKRLKLKGKNTYEIPYQNLKSINFVLNFCDFGTSLIFNEVLKPIFLTLTLKNNSRNPLLGWNFLKVSYNLCA